MPVKLRNHTYNFTKRVITAHKPKELTAMFSNNLVIIFVIFDLKFLVSNVLCFAVYSPDDIYCSANISLLLYNMVCQ